jgi:hypothetical protein
MRSGRGDKDRGRFLKSGSSLALFGRGDKDRDLAVAAERKSPAESKLARGGGLRLSPSGARYLFAPDLFVSTLDLFVCTLDLIVCTLNLSVGTLGREVMER